MDSHSYLQYGKALYRVASVQKAEEQVFKELRSALKLFEDVSFIKVLKNASQLDKKRLDALLENVFGKTFHPLIVRLMKMLGGAQKLMLVPKVYQAYRSLYFSDKNICDVRIVAARPIEKKEAEKIAEGLQASKHQEINVEFDVDPSLIGGVQVYEGSYITDYSIRNYLRLLERKLLSH